MAQQQQKDDVFIAGCDLAQEEASPPYRGEPFPTAKKDNNNGDGDDDTSSSSKSAEHLRVPLLAVFQYADKADIILMVVGTVAAIGAGGGLPAFSFSLGRLLNDLLTADPEEAAAESALIMVYIGIGVSFACMIHVGCWCVAAVRQVSRVRARFFSAVLRQDMGWHDAHRPGELTARMTGDTRVLQNGINDRLSQGVLNLAMGIFGFVFGFVFCWELTLVMLGMVPFVALCGAFTGNVLAKATSESRKQFAQAGSLATEVIENIRTVQVFGRQDYEVARFHEAVRMSERPGMRRELMNALSVGATLGLIILTYTVVFFFASYLIIWGRTDVGDIVSTFLSVLMGSVGIGFFFPSLTAFTESRAAAYHLFQTIARVPDIDIADEGGKPVDSFQDSISFRNVKFSYPTRPDQVLFTDLNLVIKKGQKVAFSGASGCGKSSIIGLLQRFYDPLSGAVLVDNTDMRELNLFDWREQIGIVSQEPNLFAGTMLENVRVGKQDASMEEVVDACKQANIHDTIMSLPQQYDTPVGTVGSQLSGGQKQRIAIARALIKRPAILLLDEATSALDRKSEIEVQTALDELMKGSNMTIVIIAHRLATIRAVDCIYYVSYDGVQGSVIAEQGTYDELMSRGGLFAAMATAQGHAGASAATQDKSDSNHVMPSSGSGEQDDINQFLDSAQMAALDREAPRTERQQVPIEKLADWEVSRTFVSSWRLLAMNKKNAWAIVLGLLGSLMAGAVAPVNTILLGKLLNAMAEYEMTHIFDQKASEDRLHEQINIYAPVFVAVAAGAFGGWLLQFFYGYAGEHMTTALRTMLFKQILRQDMSFFDIPGRDAGTLSGMLSGDCEAIHQLCGPAIGIRIQTVCTVMIGIIIGLVYQWQLALVATACLPLIVVAALMEQMMMIGANRQKEGDNDDTLVTEALSNVRTVTSFNLRSNRMKAYDALLAVERPRTVRKNIIVGIIYGASQFVYYGSFALCYWYGGKLIKQNKSDFEKVNVASLAVLMGAISAGEAGGFAAKMGDARKASARVFSVIDRVPDLDVLDPARTSTIDFNNNNSTMINKDGEQQQQPQEDDNAKGCSVSLRRTQFIYPARTNQVVLASVDLDFPVGSTNGLMGQTGCGKSTIIQLLACFYLHRRGEVRINSALINQLNIGVWRRSISYVQQEPDLFSGTVADNIRYSLPEGEAVSTEAIEQAAKWACIHDDVMAMPEGYSTQVGYKGRALSGGQKQRVAIARGLLRSGTRLLLLDEATSALDNETEARVQDGLEDYLEARRQAGCAVTVISIAHRLTTIRHCDQIVVLDSGRIIEHGSHEKLIRMGGEYKTRWELYSAGQLHE